MNGRDAEEPRYIRGVPHPLPDGERVLWEGAPSARAVAAHVFHWRLLAVYFGVMLAFWFASTTEAVGTPVWWSALLVRVVLAGFVLATAYLLARLVASTTWYAITSERVVLRIGMVLSMSINIPFSLIGAAGVGRFRDGTGQVLLQITPGHRLAYIALWPHCRVFHVNQPQPVLRVGRSGAGRGDFGGGRGPGDRPRDDVTPRAWDDCGASRRRAPCRARAGEHLGRGRHHFRAGAGRSRQRR